MVFLIVSDLHSNVESLQEFIRLSKKIPHDKVICLGDIVGYNANPNEVVDWVRENTDLALAGNHDYAVVEKTDTSYFNSYALKACEWTREALTMENFKYLQSLPAMEKKYRITWAHSSPYEPEEWHYITNPYDGVDNFPAFDTQLCFVGHTHRPLILKQEPDGNIEAGLSEEYEVKPDSRYIINVGSLGQPRDGNPQASFVSYDTETRLLKFHRFDYDMEATQEKIHDEGLPTFLADRLAAGV